jgi:hypothetical protein
MEERKVLKNGDSLSISMTRQLNSIGKEKGDEVGIVEVEGVVVVADKDKIPNVRSMLRAFSVLSNDE